MKRKRNFRDNAIVQHLSALGLAAPRTKKNLKIVGLSISAFPAKVKSTLSANKCSRNHGSDAYSDGELAAKPLSAYSNANLDWIDAVSVRITVPKPG